MASRLKFDQGVSHRDRSDLAPGEAQVMTGFYYKPGDDRAWKVPGRSTFGDSGSAAKIKGLALLKYDSGGTDRLIAYSGTVYYTATPGATGTFSSFQTGRNASGTHLTSVHYNDRWYLGNGYDRNTAVESDGTVRSHGMLEPAQAPTVAVSAGGAAARPTASSGTGFTNPASAYDATGEYLSTYAYASASAAATKTTTWTTWGADATASRYLFVKWGLAGLPPEDGSDRSRTTKEFDVTVLLEKSEDSGTNWTTVVSYTNATSSIADNTAQVAVTANSNLIHFRATLTYNEGTKAAALRVYDVRIATGSTTANFSTVVGLYYVLTEYDATRDLESPYVTSAKVTLSTQNTATLTLPSAALNSNATMWRVYRTHDGGTAPQDARLIGTTAIANTTFIDDFTIDKDTPGTLTLPLLKIQPDQDQDPIYVPMNGTPGAFVHMNAYGPFLIGLSPQFPRSLYYSLPGFAEYWPSIYLVDSFPLAERDELVCTAAMGDTLLVGAAEAMFAIDGLPEATGGVYQSATVRAMKGQPGCVGRYAMTSFSVEGEPRAAWVSPFGIHITNGQTAKRISDDIAWQTTVNVATLSTAVLHWDRQRSLLIFAYDSDGGGTNDRYWTIHMGPEHVKANGMPKWTGPHYGNIACLASGMVSSLYRVWGGHVSNGIVYLEWDTAVGTDSSQAYSSTQVPAIYTSGRSYQDHDNSEVDWVNLRHTDWGTGQTGSLAWTAGTDYASTTDTSTKTVSVASQKGTEVYIGRAGEWHEFTFTHTGSGNGALLDLRIKGTVSDETGET